MTDPYVFPDWRNLVSYPAEGADPRVLAESDKYKVVVTGLREGQSLPVHPAPTGVYIFLEGSGEMRVADQVHPVSAGTTIVVPAGANRGITATRQLAFIAVRIIE